MPTIEIKGRQLDARPDRIDYRDRAYQPKLSSLPDRYPHPKFIEQYFPTYAASSLVLDQLNEGACTGFGLAAVINYLLWKRNLESETQVDFSNADFLLRPNAVLRRPPTKPVPIERVSERMLYNMARIYDEWPGEDYDGSSCRGAMKGWHKHGVTTEVLWPYFVGEQAKFVKPKDGWQSDAAKRPLGAYYRIDKDSVNDMQAAISEVGAIYVSAAVHGGWFWQKARGKKPALQTDEGTPLTVIPLDRPDETGGHAFALVGYTPHGFIVQNSWGQSWGYKGFAILSYDDWIQHGTDAWVAVLGAPMLVAAPRTRSKMSLRDVADGKASWSWRSDSTASGFEHKDPATEPFSQDDAYKHTVVLGNNGRPVNQFLDRETPEDAVAEAALHLPLAWLSQQAKPKLAVYAHGGLNSEDASINRIRVMAPYFVANQVYPLFITWRTGFLESIDGILEDAVAKFFMPSGVTPAKGFLDNLKQQVSEARDLVIEAACERVLVKAVWSQMKKNAAAAAKSELTATTDPDAPARSAGGLLMIVRHLATLKKSLPNLELHLVGHSAGSILLGHLLDLLVGKVPATTLSLYAPACTVRFALDYYVPAVKNKVVAKSAILFDILSNERERADSVGPYGKSLLYLVSRALEDVHKMPLLGMQWAWETSIDGVSVEKADVWHAAKLADVKEWQDFVSPGKGPMLGTHDDETINDGEADIPLAHGSFDNDVKVVTATLERIRGAKLLAKVESLHGF